VLSEGGIQVLDRDARVVDIDDVQVGVVGVKGFVGGFTGSHLPDFGEPLLREVYAETSRDVAALDRGLREVRMCPIRIVLLHYAPTADTIAGEPEGIWSFLGSDRLAAPIAEHEPDLVLHGHAHAGTFEGRIDSVPVYNVAVHVTRRDFWLFELDVPRPAAVPIH
jgi:Icc-related predicted phosphoesterase